MKKVKKYTVNIDMTWSEDVKVTAKTEAEARRKAWEKFKKRVPRKNFSLSADED
jgi:hypothetical protein